MEVGRLKKTIALLLAAVMLFALAACSKEEPAPVVENIQEKVIGTKEVTLDLEENPTTGYSWEYSISDETVLEYVKDEYIDPSASAESSEGEEPVVGASGVRRFTFNPLSDGTVTVEFRYSRPWENEGEGLWDMCYVTYNVHSERATVEKNIYTKYCQGTVSEAAEKSFSVDLGDGLVIPFVYDDGTNMNGGTIRSNSKILVEYRDRNGDNYAYFVLVSNETGFDQFQPITIELHCDALSGNKWYAVGTESFEASIDDSMEMDNAFVKGTIKPVTEGTDTIQFIYGKSAVDEDPELRLAIGITSDSDYGEIIDSVIFSGKLIAANSAYGEGTYSISAEELPEEYSGLTVSLDTCPDKGFGWICTNIGDDITVEEYFNEYEEADPRTTYVISSESEGSTSVLIRYSDRSSDKDYSGVFDISFDADIQNGKIFIRSMTVAGNALLPE